jgi:hypothetical protein
MVQVHALIYIQAQEEILIQVQVPVFARIFNYNCDCDHFLLSDSALIISLNTYTNLIQSLAPLLIHAYIE